MAWLYQRPDSNKWWIGWRVNGKQFLKSTKETDKAKAEKQLADFEFIERAKAAGRLTDEFMEALSGRARPKITLHKAIGIWLDECRGSTSAGTVEKYEPIAGEFLKHIGATETRPVLADVTTDEIRAYLAKRRAKTAGSTVNVERKILASFFNLAMDNHWIRENPITPIKALKLSAEEKLRRRPFTADEIRTLFTKAPDDFWRYMVIAGFYSGQRMGDLICLKWGNVDFDENMIRLVAGKTGAQIKVPLRQSLRDLLLTQRGRGKKPTDYLWPDRARAYITKGSGQFSNQFYDEVLTPAGLVPKRAHRQRTKNGRDVKRDTLPVSFHCLRHSFVSLLKATGGNQAVAKELAGHNSDMVSNLYTTMPIETLTQAVNQLPEVT
jgi:integrase